MALDREIAGSESGRLHGAMARMRTFMAHHLLLLMFYRLLIITLGFLLLVAGLVMLVTPGPGWLFIFLGMGLWGTEFHWAHRLNTWGKAKVLNIWREITTQAEKRNQKKQNARWLKFGRQNHFCPTGEHYHEHP